MTADRRPRNQPKEIDMSYQKMIRILAARRCYAAGQSIREIATSANKSPSTIRRWLKKAGAL